MKPWWILLVLAALGGAAKTEGAVVTVLNSGGNTVDDFSGPGLVAVDPDFATLLPLTLSIKLEAGDLGSPLAFNSIVDNLTGSSWIGYTLTLVGATWSYVGDIDVGPFGALESVTPPQGPVGAGVTAVEIAFLDEPDGFALGDPLLLGGTDWSIDYGTLGEGDTFTLTLQPQAAPEPASLAIWLVIGAALAFPKLRRRSQTAKVAG